ncbi:MAG: PRC-barrel domain-containing protein [Verrucomicrobia subdivision 3 bacterium]|nr:PRC-barrel domain-containing protein [Limisphaerales bacterium]
MKKTSLLFCVATSLIATTALAQRETSPSSTDKPTTSSPSTYSPTGRSLTGRQQHFRSQKILGAQVKTSTGEDVGRIEDVVLNPSSGKIDFAVISMENKLYPVPWQLLSLSSQSSAQGGTSSSTSTTTGTSPQTTPSTPSSTTPGASPSIYASASMGQPTFTLNVDKSKLQQTPSFDRSRWPEMTATWSQQIYAHFGVRPDTGVGGTGTGSTTLDQGSTGKSTSDTDTDTDKIKK